MRIQGSLISTVKLQTLFLLKPSSVSLQNTGWCSDSDKFFHQVYRTSGSVETSSQTLDFPSLYVSTTHRERSGNFSRIIAMMSNEKVESFGQAIPAVASIAIEWMSVSQASVFQQSERKYVCLVYGCQSSIEGDTEHWEGFNSMKIQSGMLLNSGLSAASRLLSPADFIDESQQHWLHILAKHGADIEYLKLVGNS